MRSLTRVLFIGALLFAQTCFGQFAVSSPGFLFPKTYSAEAQAVFTNLTNPTIREKDAIAKFVDREVSRGNWTLTLEAQCRAMQTEANSLKGWKGVFNATNTGATHVPGYGFQYDGSDDVVDTGFNPNGNGGSIFSQNSGGIGWFVKDNNSPTVAGAIGGCLDASNRRTAILQSGGISYRVNGATAITYTTDNHVFGGSFYAAYRTSSSNLGLLLNGRSIDSGGANTSNARAQINAYEGALNNLGSTTSFMAIDVGFFIVYNPTGFSQQGLYDDLIALMIDLEGGYPNWVQPLYEIVGQSNAVGKTLDTPSSSALTDPIPGVYIKIAAFDQLDYPTNNQGNNFGIELTMGKALQEHYSKDIYLQKTAYEGIPVHIDLGGFDFNVASAGERYEALRDNMRAAQAALHLLEKAPYTVLILLHGEAELSNDTDAGNFMTNWTDVFNQLRVDGCSFSYLVIGNMADGVGTAPAARVAILNQSIINFVGQQPKNRIILNKNFFGLGGDNIHHTGAQYESMGDWTARLLYNNTLKP